ncbi:unnamed protein product [Bursaphelenchus xylophilus]|uniref:(pine wood nematode) hypothetical protein n=1 Tax=Bursaphelenchus xylophilus TaxID=6326 RepID=A0A1I7RLT2_BURXY|nr:unnamed protein product [Bursaphelenchus xylophilus]CAG9106278.1 unnamed protein product [Bursaphelenchus xylophilus]
MWCNFFQSRQNAVLFDGGLRIESPGRVLYKNKWLNRYVVCQRRNGAEAPLIGLFKNDKTREKGQHLELFYMQNYIGYEYGFKAGRTTKTLALIMENRILVLSFWTGECMVLWKEWLRDICGRSFIFCMHVNHMSRTATLQLVGNEVRIHLTKTMLTVVQGSPPLQIVCLSLRSLGKVECSEGELSFEASVRTWLKPHSFSFSGDHTAQIHRTLRLLLKPDQFVNPIPNPSDSIHTNVSVLQAHPSHMHLTHGNGHSSRPRPADFITNSMPMLAQLPRSNTPTIATTPAQTLPLPPRRNYATDRAGSLIHHYVNTGPTELTAEEIAAQQQAQSQSLTSLMQQTSMASALTTMPSEFETFDDADRQYFNVHPMDPSGLLTSMSNNGSAGRTGSIQSIHPSLNFVHRRQNSQTPSGHAVQPVIREDEQDHADHSSFSNEESQLSHEKVYATAETVQTSISQENLVSTSMFMPPKTSNTPAANTMGLVRPNVNIPLLGRTVDTPVRRSLKKKLLDAVSGSFEQYDGDNTTKGYADEDSETFARVFDAIPTSDTSPNSTTHHRRFDHSVSSSTRLETAVQRQREKMKEKEKRRSVTSVSSTDTSSGSAYQTVPVKMPKPHKTVAYSVTPTESINTLITNTVSDDRTSFNTAIYTGSAYQGSVIGGYEKSTATLPEVEENSRTDSVQSKRSSPPHSRGISTVSLPVQHQLLIQSSLPRIQSQFIEEDDLGSQMSIQSELNDRIVFERGRTRASGRSANKNRSADHREQKQPASSLNYVSIDPSSTAAWLEKYKREQAKLKHQK